MYDAEELRTAQSTALNAIEGHLDQITADGRRTGSHQDPFFIQEGSQTIVQGSEDCSKERNQLEELKIETELLLSKHFGDWRCFRPLDFQIF